MQYIQSYFGIFLVRVHQGHCFLRVVAFQFTNSKIVSYFLGWE